ncbi:MAG: exo-alpha-sialidase [Clostridia bacterium]|nr:exo-alpha-sialidase [Clostridia bacterium]
MNTITPEVTHGIVNRAKNTIFSYQGWPSICRDENGTLYAVASGFRVEHVCPFGKTVMYISKNDGKTWTPPIVINDTYLDDRDAGILYMGNGRMLVTWFSHSTKFYLDPYFTWIKNHAAPVAAGAVVGMLGGYPFVPEELSKGGSFIRVSEDYGVTWSDTIQIPVSAPHGPILCRDGSLLYLGKEMYADHIIPKGAVCAYKSTDGGYTWNQTASLSFPEGTIPGNFHEPHAIELPDGRILGMIRVEGKNLTNLVGYTMYQTISEDGGKTWTIPAPTDVSGSPPHLMLHSSGALICSYGRRNPPHSERAMISWDYGKTWTEEYVIDDRPTDYDLGYPASVELNDGSILTVYYQKFSGDQTTSILYSRWKLKK